MTGALGGQWLLLINVMVDLIMIEIGRSPFYPVFNSYLIFWLLFLCAMLTHSATEDILEHSVLAILSNLF